MGEETKVEKMFMSIEDGPGFVWNGLDSVTTDISNEPIDGECSFTLMIKIPKFFRCKNRKRYKKLMMSCGFSRNYMDRYLKDADYLRFMVPNIPGYQKLWDCNRRLVYGL